MKISARVENSENQHQVILTTNDNSHSIVIPSKYTGFGSSANCGELLFLALATCYCNNLYREAKKRNIEIQKVEVEVNGDFGAEGFDDDLPATRISVHFKHPSGEITLARIRALSRLKGSVDTEGIFGTEPYEMYFMGFEGQAGSDCETEISYHFAMRENQTGLQMGSVTGISMKGWDIAWGNVTSQASGGYASRNFNFVNVVRIPKERALKTLLGFG